MLISTPTAQIYELYLDISNQKFIDPNGFDIKPIQLFINSQIVFRLTCYDDYLNDIVSDLKNVNMLWGFDSTFITHHNDLINITTFNDTDDWADVDPENGKICWRVDTSSFTIIDFIGSSKTKTVYSDLWMIGDEDPWEPDILINADTMTLRNVMSPAVFAE